MYAGTLKTAVSNRRRKPSKSVCRVERRLSSLQEFKQRMALEKRRAERTSYSSSIIFFNIKPRKQHSTLKNSFIKDIAKLICVNIRFTDVVMLYKSHTILILLPDTNSSGAKCAFERMAHVILRVYSRPFNLKLDDFHIKILSFPERQSEPAALPKTIPQNGKSQHVRASDMRAPQEMVFKRDYLTTLNLCRSSFNGSVISMGIEDAFFWDQELVSKVILFGKKLGKTLFDQIGASLALLIFFPVMLVIAFVVKVTSPGPVFYKQRRVGYRGRCFTFYKFRSMYTQIDENVHQEYVKKLINGQNNCINNGTSEDPFYKITDDPRITPFGKFLRRTSLDELPQLFNVLRGEMSLVGPRPPIPYEVEEYKNWHFRRILEVKPGITGLWQVSGRNRLSFDNMVRLDIKYAESWSLRMDVKILLKTIKVVFVADGQ